MTQTKRWNKLDNAAKIFPPTTSNRSTNVFRFVCELKEPVDAVVLQKALEQTLLEFPLYRSVLKQGVFWYYFEESDIVPQVIEENLPACSPLYIPDKPGLLFRVMYFGERINLEVFHALADGSGAIQFLRVLVYYYLAGKYALSGHLSDYDASPEQKAQDAFYKYYDKTGKFSDIVKLGGTRPYHIRGESLPDNRKLIIDGFMPVKAVLAKAHELNATLSEFLISHLFCAVFQQMAVREYSKPAVITVPVDLRKYFDAQTAGNFFAVVKITHNVGRDGQSFENVLDNVRESLRAQLTQENMRGIINRYSVIENNPFIKAVPLPVKIPALALSGIRAEAEDSAVFSNTGIISMPEEAARHIRCFSVCISAKRPQMCLCSFGETLAVSISSPYSDTTIQRHFFRALTSIGINLKVISNMEQMQAEENENAVL